MSARRCPAALEGFVAGCAEAWIDPAPTRLEIAAGSSSRAATKQKMRVSRVIVNPHLQEGQLVNQEQRWGVAPFQTKWAIKTLVDPPAFHLLQERQPTLRQG